MDLVNKFSEAAADVLPAILIIAAIAMAAFLMDHIIYTSTDAGRAEQTQQRQLRCIIGVTQTAETKEMMQIGIQACQQLHPG